jgi:hypothetical protein
MADKKEERNGIQPYCVAYTHLGEANGRTGVGGGTSGLGYAIVWDHQNGPQQYGCRPKDLLIAIYNRLVAIQTHTEFASDDNQEDIDAISRAIDCLSRKRKEPQ